MKLKVQPGPAPNTAWRPMADLVNEYLSNRENRSKQQLFWARFEGQIYLCLYHPRLQGGIKHSPEVGLLGIAVYQGRDGTDVLDYEDSYWDLNNLYEAQIVKDHCVVATGPE